MSQSSSYVRLRVIELTAAVSGGKKKKLREWSNDEVVHFIKTYNPAWAKFAFNFKEEDIKGDQLAAMTLDVMTIYTNDNKRTAGAIIAAVAARQGACVPVPLDLFSQHSQFCPVFCVSMHRGRKSRW